MKKRNCPNCGAPYDINFYKCPYCNTLYFDMTDMCIEDGTPVYFGIKTNKMMNGQPTLITFKGIPHLDTITINQDDQSIIGRNGVEITKIVNRRSANLALNFDIVADENNCLFNVIVGE